jgi:hypothetical protein
MIKDTEARYLVENMCEAILRFEQHESLADITSRLKEEVRNIALTVEIGKNGYRNLTTSGRIKVHDNGLLEIYMHGNSYSTFIEPIESKSPQPKPSEDKKSSSSKKEKELIPDLNDTLIEEQIRLLCSKKRRHPRIKIRESIEKVKKLEDTIKKEKEAGNTILDPLFSIKKKEEEILLKELDRVFRLFDNAVWKMNYICESGDDRIYLFFSKEKQCYAGHCTSSTCKFTEISKEFAETSITLFSKFKFDAYHDIKILLGSFPIQTFEVKFKEEENLLNIAEQSLLAIDKKTKNFTTVRKCLIRLGVLSAEASIESC